MSRLDQNLIMGPEAFLTQKTAEMEDALAKGIFKNIFLLPTLLNSNLWFFYQLQS